MAAPLLTLDEAAEQLRVPRRLLLGWVRGRKIEAVRLSRKAIRISQREVDRLIRVRTEPVLRIWEGNR